MSIVGQQNGHVATVIVDGRVFSVPYATELRALTDAEYAGLRASIEQHGITVPIVITEDNAIIDGYHRAAVASELERAGRKLSIVPMETVRGHAPESLRELARSLNKNRRHLSEAEKRENVRQHLREHPDRADNWIAHEEGADSHTVGTVRAEMESTLEIPKLDALLGRDGKWRPTAYAKSVTAADSAAEEAGELVGDGDDCDAPQAVQQTLIMTSSPAQAQHVNAVVSGLEDVPEGVIGSVEVHRQQRAEERERQQAEYQARMNEPPASAPDRPRYRTIVIDPPWEMEKIDRDVRPNQAGFDYETMSVDEIAQWPLANLMADDVCHVYMWTTQKYLPAAFDLLRVWGLEYAFTMVWHKPGGFQVVGLPQYNCEFVVCGHRGPLRFLDTRAFPTCFNALRREHSRKPDEFYDLVRRVSPGPRIDVFSREQREGFAQYGNEVERFSVAGGASCVTM